MGNVIPPFAPRPLGRWCRPWRNRPWIIQSYPRRHHQASDARLSRAPDPPRDHRVHRAPTATPAV